AGADRAQHAADDLDARRAEAESRQEIGQLARIRIALGDDVEGAVEERAVALAAALDGDRSGGIFEADLAARDVRPRGHGIEAEAGEERLDRFLAEALGVFARERAA